MNTVYIDMDNVIADFEAHYLALTGNAVPTRILAPTGTTGPGVVIDANINANFVTLAPISALSTNMTYTATFSGVANGTPMTSTWSFTTGATGNSTTNI